jgi:hypothetical protein
MRRKDLVGFAGPSSSQLPLADHLDTLLMLLLVPLSLLLPLLVEEDIVGHVALSGSLA